jgi:hypothetical protein
MSAMAIFRQLRSRLSLPHLGMPAKLQMSWALAYGYVLGSSNGGQSQHWDCTLPFPNFHVKMTLPGVFPLFHQNTLLSPSNCFNNPSIRFLWNCGKWAHVAWKNGIRAEKSAPDPFEP